MQDNKLPFEDLPDTQIYPDFKTICLTYITVDEQFEIKPEIVKLMYDIIALRNNKIGYVICYNEMQPYLNRIIKYRKIKCPLLMDISN